MKHVFHIKFWIDRRSGNFFLSAFPIIGGGGGRFIFLFS